MRNKTKISCVSKEGTVKIIYATDYTSSKLECSFKSKNPDYGTETMAFNVDTHASFFWLATHLLKDLSDFLDETCDGTVRRGSVAKEFEEKYGDLNNTTMIHIENVLRNIVGVQPDGRSVKDETVATVREIITKNVLTGNNVRLPEGAKGKIIKVNERRSWNKEYVNIELIQFDSVLDYQTQQPVQVWLSSLDTEGYEESTD